MPRTDRWSPRVAVVGLGAVTALGGTSQELWEGAVAGRVAIAPVQRIDMSGLDTKLAGEAEGPSGDAFSERALDLALVAAEEALAPLPEHLDPARVGLVLGTCNAGLLSGREWLLAETEGRTPDPSLIPLVTAQGLAEGVAAHFGLRGPVLAVNTACASGANAIGLAADLLRLGRCDAVLAGGTDALSDVVLAGFNSLQSLAPEPAAPYSGNRNGLSLGEGAGMLLLVRASDAEGWDLPVVAEVAGYGLSADGYHVTAPRPDGSGAAEAIRSALQRSGVEPSGVCYVNGHGTGTPKNDPAETKAIRLAFGPHADELLVSSTKSMVGHLLGAAGAVEAIVTVKALEEQTAPPTAGFEVTDPECDLSYVTDGAVALKGDAAVSNNFAFAGANASVVFTRPGAGSAPPRPDFDEVVITGTSVLGPAGEGAAVAWEAFLSGSDPSTLEDGLRIGRVQLDPEPYLSRKQRRRMDRLSVLSVVSATQALADAALESDRTGVLFATGVGPMEAMEQFTLPLFGEGPAAANPAVFPNTVYNQAAGQVAMHLGLFGPTSTLSVGHASGAAAVAYAADLLSSGFADALVVVVTDTLIAPVVRAYAALGLVSGEPSDGRSALAEGSVSLVLERRGAAQARGARILGTVAGAASSFAPLGSIADVRGDGVERAMRAAVAEGGVQPASVWPAAGPGSADRAEKSALSRVFGAADLPVYAPRDVLGEPMGAAGALDLALALHARAAGAVPDGPLLVNSSSLGGTHVSLLIT